MGCDLAVLTVEAVTSQFSGDVEKNQGREGLVGRKFPKKLTALRSADHVGGGCGPLGPVKVQKTKTKRPRRKKNSGKN